MTPRTIGANELTRSGIGFSLADESSSWSKMLSVQSTLHRIEYLTFGAIVGSKSGETRHKCGRAAKSRAGLCNARHGVHHIGPDWSPQGQFARRLLYFPIFTVFTTCAQRRASHTTFPFFLFPRALLAGLVGNFTLTNFFAIATQSSQPHRIFRQRDNSLHGLPMRLGQANRHIRPVSIESRSSNHAHRITLIESRSSNHAHRITLA